MTGIIYVKNKAIKLTKYEGKWTNKVAKVKQIFVNM